MGIRPQHCDRSHPGNTRQDARDAAGRDLSTNRLQDCYPPISTMKIAGLLSSEFISQSCGSYISTTSGAYEIWPMESGTQSDPNHPKSTFLSLQAETWYLDVYVVKSWVSWRKPGLRRQSNIRPTSQLARSFWWRDMRKFFSNFNRSLWELWNCWSHKQPQVPKAKWACLWSI